LNNFNKQVLRKHAPILFTVQSCIEVYKLSFWLQYKYIDYSERPTGIRKEYLRKRFRKLIWLFLNLGPSYIPKFSVLTKICTSYQNGVICVKRQKNCVTDE